MKLEIPGVEVRGEFNTQRFFDTLALILSHREGMKITVKVIQDEAEEDKEAV